MPEHQIPLLGSDGETYRNQQLIYQLPKQDLTLSQCKYLDKEFVALFENFVNSRNESALDIGYVSSQLEGDEVCWHAKILMFKNIFISFLNQNKTLNFHIINLYKVSNYFSFIFVLSIPALNCSRDV